MSDSTPPEGLNKRLDRGVGLSIVAVEYAIVLSLVAVGVLVLVRTITGFFSHWDAFPESVVATIDGILVVIILLDIAHTVSSQMRSRVMAVRPFLVVGILAGIREILSSSAHLTLSRHLEQEDFKDTLLTLGVGVGVVFVLIVGLWILHLSGDEGAKV